MAEIVNPFTDEDPFELKGGRSERVRVRREKKVLIEKKKRSIKPAVLIVVVLLFIIIYTVLSSMLEVSRNSAIVVASLFALLALFINFSIVFLDEYERAVIERFGRFHRISGPGWCVVLPVMEEYSVVDTRIQTLDLSEFDVITKEQIKLVLDIVVYLRIADPRKAVLDVEDVNETILTYTRAVTRDVVGNMTMAEVISDIDKVNQLIQAEEESHTKQWGVKLISVEIEEIRLPEDVQKSVHGLKSAEYEKLAVEQRAFAREIMINALQRAAGKLTDPALSYMYLEALKKVADGKATKLIFPMELTRLAESVSSHFNVNKDKFLNDMISAYRETVAQDLEKRKR